jgi:hypothetical protein
MFTPEQKRAILARWRSDRSLTQTVMEMCGDGKTGLVKLKKTHALALKIRIEMGFPFGFPYSDICTPEELAQAIEAGELDAEIRAHATGEDYANN